jgi:acetate---CoA ligase (ADP-forming)
VDHALDIAVQDPNLDFVLFSGVTLPEARPPDEDTARTLETRVDWLAMRMGSAPIPIIPVGSTCVNLSDYGRELLRKRGITFLGGLDLAMTALGHVLRWLENRGRVRAPVPRRITAPRRPADAAAGPWSEGPWSEVRARQLLAEAGVPVVPGGLAGSADEAVEIAFRVGLPVALKICSAQITHKSDIGGIALGVHGDAQVRDAYRRVLAAGQTVPGAVIDGVLVTPMRPGGVELLVGVTVDRAFGPVLAVGLGGVWVELLADTSLRVLPVTTDDVKHMLSELRGSPLLRGARGTRPADLDVLAQVVKNVGDAALSLDGNLRALEINPLWVDGDRIEALDVLVVADGS